MAAEEPSDRTVDDMEVHMKQGWGIECDCKKKKMAPIDIHWHLLNVYGDQAVDVSKKVLANQRSAF